MDGESDSDDPYYEEPIDDSDADADYVPDDLVNDHVRGIAAAEDELEVDEGDWEESDAAEEIEGDFDRLIGIAQSTDRTNWEFELGEDVDLRDKSKSSRRRTRRNRREPELSHEVTQILASANSAYMNQSYPLAIQLFRNITKIEPYAHAPWATLALCYAELGDDAEALKVEVVAAHLGVPDVELWRDLGRRSRERGALQQALYCFRTVLKIDRQDVDALYDRASILQELGQHKKALEDLSTILDSQPTNADVLERLRSIYIDLGQPDKARSFFQEAFDQSRGMFPSGPGTGIDIEIEIGRPLDSGAIARRVEEGVQGVQGVQGEQREQEERPWEFGARQLAHLADFYIWTGDYEGAVGVVREGARWLDGRLVSGSSSSSGIGGGGGGNSASGGAGGASGSGSGTRRGHGVSQNQGKGQSPWDIFNDDREFDVPGFEPEGGGRRSGHHGHHVYSSSSFSSTFSGGMGSGLHGGNGFRLPVELRARLLIARLHLGDFEEAKMHLAIIFSYSFDANPDLFFDIAEVFFGMGLYEDALPIYFDLSARQETSSMHILSRVGECQTELKAHDDAIEVYKFALEKEPGNTHIKRMLANVYEMTGQLQLALELVEAVRDGEPGSPISHRKRLGRHSLASPDGEVNSEGEEGSTSPTLALGSLFDETSLLQSSSTSNKNRRRKPGSLTQSHEQLLEHEAHQERLTLSAFDRLDKAEGGMVRGERVESEVWLIVGGEVVEGFRVTRQLFLSDRFAPFKGMTSRKKQKKAQDGEGDGVESARDMANRLRQELDEEELQSIVPIAKGVDHFRGIKFDRWLLMFTQYTFLLTREGQYPLANEILKHIALSNVFTSFHHQNTIRIATMTCAIHNRDYKTIIDEGRSFTLDFQFNNDAFRLTLACLANGGLQAHDAYVDKNYQKFMKRDLGFWEKAGSGVSFMKGRRKYAFIPDAGGGKSTGKERGEGKGKGNEKAKDDNGKGKAKGGEDTSDGEEPHSDGENDDRDEESPGPDPESDADLEEVDEAEVDIRPTAGGSSTANTKTNTKEKQNPKARISRGIKDKDKDFDRSVLSRNPAPDMATRVSPVALVNYAQISLASRSFQTARYYLLMALKLQPRDPLICLNLGVACIGRAMQRQADNRHHLILEGLAHLSKYREYRKDDRFADEVEYNFGRSFHQLNLLSLAVKHYEEALSVIAKRLESSPNNGNAGCAREAAYNLSLIYVMSGAPGQARALYKRWLSV